MDTKKFREITSKYQVTGKTIKDIITETDKDGNVTEVGFIFNDNSQFWCMMIQPDSRENYMHFSAYTSAEAAEPQPRLSRLYNISKRAIGCPRY